MSVERHRKMSFTTGNGLTYRCHNNILLCCATARELWWKRQLFAADAWTSWI